MSIHDINLLYSYIINKILIQVYKSLKTKYYYIQLFFYILMLIYSINKIYMYTYYIYIYIYIIIF